MYKVREREHLLRALVAPTPQRDEQLTLICISGGVGTPAAALVSRCTNAEAQRPATGRQQTHNSALEQLTQTTTTRLNWEDRWIGEGQGLAWTFLSARPQR